LERSCDPQISPTRRNLKTPLSYIELVAQYLRDGNADYGFFHAPRHWYAGAWADPDEELCHDKQYFSSHPKFLKRAKIVVRAAIHLAQKLRINQEERATAQ
jgi:hypothetical protein